MYLKYLSHTPQAPDFSRGVVDDKHFSSKDEIVEAMYQFLREQPRKNANINFENPEEKLYFSAAKLLYIETTK